MMQKLRVLFITVFTWCRLYAHRYIICMCIRV